MIFLINKLLIIFSQSCISCKIDNITEHSLFRYIDAFSRLDKKTQKKSLETIRLMQRSLRSDSLKVNLHKFVLLSLSKQRRASNICLALLFITIDKFIPSHPRLHPGHLPSHSTAPVHSTAHSTSRPGRPKAPHGCQAARSLPCQRQLSCRRNDRRTGDG